MTYTNVDKHALLPFILLSSTTQNFTSENYQDINQYQFYTRLAPLHSFQYPFFKIDMHHKPGYNVKVPLKVCSHKKSEKAADCGEHIIVTM
jgi:hypothetical protein